MAPTVSSISIDASNVLSAVGGGAAPGAPVEVVASVKGDNGTPGDTSDDVVLKDQPVTVSVDRGFLSPDASTVSGLTLAEGHRAAGDLWGYVRNDGTSASLTTGDAGNWIRVSVTESRTAYTSPSAAATSSSLQIALGTFTNTVLPTMSANPKVGVAVTSTNGTWSVTPDRGARITGSRR